MMATMTKMMINFKQKAETLAKVLRENYGEDGKMLAEKLMHIMASNNLKCFAAKTMDLLMKQDMIWRGCNHLHFMITETNENDGRLTKIEKDAIVANYKDPNAVIKLLDQLRAHHVNENNKLQSIIIGHNNKIEAKRQEIVALNQSIKETEKKLQNDMMTLRERLIGKNKKEKAAAIKQFEIKLAEKQKDCDAIQSRLKKSEEAMTNYHEKVVEQAMNKIPKPVYDELMGKHNDLTDDFEQLKVEYDNTIKEMMQARNANRNLADQLQELNFKIKHLELTGGGSNSLAHPNMSKNYQNNDSTVDDDDSSDSEIEYCSPRQRIIMRSKNKSLKREDITALDVMTDSYNMMMKASNMFDDLSDEIKKKCHDKKHLGDWLKEETDDKFPSENCVNDVLNSPLSDTEKENKILMKLDKFKKDMMAHRAKVGAMINSMKRRGVNEKLSFNPDQLMTKSKKFKNILGTQDDVAEENIFCSDIEQLMIDLNMNDVKMGMQLQTAPIGNIMNGQFCFMDLMQMTKVMKAPDSTKVLVFGRRNDLNDAEKINFDVADKIFESNLREIYEKSEAQQTSYASLQGLMTSFFGQNMNNKYVSVAGHTGSSFNTQDAFIDSKNRKLLTTQANKGNTDLIWAKNKLGEELHAIKQTMTKFGGNRTLMTVATNDGTQTQRKGDTVMCPFVSLRNNAGNGSKEESFLSPAMIVTRNTKIIILRQLNSNFALKYETNSGIGTEIIFIFKL